MDRQFVNIIAEKNKNKTEAWPMVRNKEVTPSVAESFFLLFF
jgi:hypothetical protein